MSKNKAAEPLDSPTKRLRYEVQPLSLFDDREDSETTGETSSDIETLILEELIAEHDSELFNPEVLNTPADWRNNLEADLSPILVTPLHNTSGEVLALLQELPFGLVDNITSPDEFENAFVVPSSNSSSPTSSPSSALARSESRSDTLSSPNTTTSNDTIAAIEFVSELIFPPLHGINLAFEFPDY